MGVGFQPLPLASGIVAENNFFRTEPGVTPDQFIASFTGGRAIFVAGTLHESDGGLRGVDALAAYNAVRDPDLARQVGWDPRIYREFDTTERVAIVVPRDAGPFAW